MQKNCNVYGATNGNFQKYVGISFAKFIVGQDLSFRTLRSSVSTKVQDFVLT